MLAVANKERRGLHVATPVFDGANEDEIGRLLGLSRQPVNGRSPLFDGHTGDAFDQDVTVGVMYMLKLHHLVDEKIHAARSGACSSPSSRWAARRSSVVSDSVRWKSGRWRATAPPSPFKSS